MMVNISLKQIFMSLRKKMLFDRDFHLRRQLNIHWNTPWMGLGCWFETYKILILVDALFRIARKSFYCFFRSRNSLWNFITSRSPDDEEVMRVGRWVTLTRISCINHHGRSSESWGSMHCEMVPRPHQSICEKKSLQTFQGSSTLSVN